jgi:hypothetical protein
VFLGLGVSLSICVVLCVGLTFVGLCWSEFVECLDLFVRYLFCWVWGIF